MTRLTVAVTGDPLTFRPVTSSVVRKSKDGDVNVIVLLFGTHYNISIAGILQIDVKGEIEPTTQVLHTVGHELQITMERKTGGTGIPEMNGSFGSFTYFYPGLKIQGHLKLDITNHVLPVPELEAHYHFVDLLNGDFLDFRLILEENNLKFEVVEQVSGVENVLYSEVLGVGVDEYYFQFVYNVNSKSKIYKYENFETLSQTRTRKWVGDVKAALGECNVTVALHNEEETLHTLSSTVILLEYPQIFTKFDREVDDRFVGQVKMYDDLGKTDETLWKQIRSRDYKFIGNRIIENGMIRVVIKTNNPVLEIWGWNYNAITPAWEKSHTIFTDTDTGDKSLKLQNISFEYFSKMQIKVDVNFGTSVYSFIMTRGDPYITMLNKAKKKFKISTDYDRLGGDFANRANGYTLDNTALSGTPLALKATGSIVCAGVLAADTVTINGLVYTGVAGVKSDNTEFSIDTDDTATALDLADSITNDTRTGITEPTIGVSGTSGGAVITLTARAGGIAANNIDTTSSNGTRLAMGAATLVGGAATGGSGVETLSGFSMLDNYFGVYNAADDNAVVGWISNFVQPNSILLEDNAGTLEIEFTYPIVGNVFGVGVLPSFPSNIVGNVPFPFVIATQDEYIKWRANEALLSFRELESIKRR